MAQLDVVSDALFDPMISDLFTVRRRVETVSDKGRSEITPTDFEDVVGVVTAASPNDLERLPEGQRMGRNYSIVTNFRLQGPARNGSVDLQPDVILWQGSELIVKTVDPYPQFGPGFVQAIAGSMDIIDPAIEG